MKWRGENTFDICWPLNSINVILLTSKLVFIVEHRCFSVILRFYSADMFQNWNAVYFFCKFHCIYRLVNNCRQIVLNRNIIICLFVIIYYQINTIRMNNVLYRSMIVENVRGDNHMDVCLHNSNLHILKGFRLVDTKWHLKLGWMENIDCN